MTRDALSHRPSITAYGWTAVAAALALTGLGLVMVYSTSAVAAARHPMIQDPAFYLRRQVVWTAIALTALAGFSYLDFRWWGKHGRVALGVAAVLLVLVLVLGTRWHGARRWLRFGGVGFQPSEAAKLAVVVFVAGEICRQKARLRTWSGFLSVFVPLALVMGLVVREPDFGTTLFLGAVGVSLLLVGGVRPSHLLLTALAALPVAAVAAHDKLDHVWKRILDWLSASKHYQVEQSLIALGSGGLSGRGIGNGRAKLGFLPESSTDFIFSVVGEELGFLGTFLVLVLFATFLYCGLRIALAALSVSRFGFFVAVGIVLMVGLQAVINIAVVTASAPTKGISLPFLSLGGSSILVFLGATGILFNVSRLCHRSRAVDLFEPEEAATW